MKNKISKIVVTIMLVLVILYCVRNVGLNMFGKTTTGYTISTTQRYDRDRNTSKRYRNTVSYYFQVSGKRYEGQASYKTNMPIVKKDDQVIEKVVVQYFEFLPHLNTLEKYNKNTILNNAFNIIFIIGTFLIILSVWGVKLKKNKLKDNNTIWTCECGTQNDGKYCETCGNKKKI